MRPRIDGVRQSVAYSTSSQVKECFPSQKMMKRKKVAAVNSVSA